MTLVRFPNHADEALSGLLATVLDAVVVINETGAIVGWNSVAETTFGWTASEVDGEIMGNLIVPVQYRAAHHAGMVRVIESGEAHVLNRRIELSAINKAGREFPVELSIVPMVAGGDRLFVGFLRDISIRR
jgi:PAS domain S-box-containing protein